MDTQKEYFAFISYKREDEKWAKWLADELEHFHLPATLNGKELPNNLRPIFRDVDELSAGNLPEQIYHALSISKNLIVVCSPRSATSEWVDKEIEDFIDIKGGKADNIYPFIIEGVPFSKKSDNECFPEKLRNLPENEERLGGNVNEQGGRKAAVVKVIAGMLGIGFDSLWQKYERKQKQRRNWMIFAAVAAFMFISGIAFWMYCQKQQTQKANWKMMENQARAVAEKSLELIDNGDSYLARLLLLEVFPYDIKKEDLNRPIVFEAERALRTAMNKNNSILRGHSKPVNSASFSPDGELVVSASSDSTIRIWDVKTGQCVRTIKGHNGSVNNANFSPDGKLIVSASDDRTVKIWDVQTGMNLKTLEGHNDVVFSSFYSPDGKLIISESRDDAILWDASSGFALYSFDIPSEVNRNASFSSNGNYLAIPSYSVFIIDAHTGQHVQNIDVCDNWLYVRSVDLSSNGQLIAMATYDDKAYICDLQSGQVKQVLNGHTLSINSVKFSQDCKRVISSSDDKTIKIWDLQTGKCLDSLGGHIASVNSASFSPDGKMIVSASMDNTARIWDSQLEQCLHSFEDFSDCTVSYNHDGKKIVSTTGWNSTILIRDSNSGKILLTLKGHNNRVNTAFFSPDDKRIVSASMDNTVKIWDTSTGECQQTLKGHTGSVETAIFSPNGKQIVSASSDHTVKIWDASTGECIQSLQGHSWPVEFATFSPDSKQIVSASMDTTIKIWDAYTGDCLRTLRGHAEHVNSAMFSPDGKQIVSASSDRTIKIWDSQTGICLQTLEGHTESVRSAEFSLDGRYIISASIDYTAKVWDTSTWECLQTLVGASSPVLSASFSPDGRNIATVGSTICIWDFPPLEQLIDETRERFKDRSLTPEERRKYYLE